MLQMSFYNGTLDRRQAAEYVKSSDKVCRYSYGYEWKHPTTYRKEVSKEEALHLIASCDFLDIDEYDEFILLNAYSENDLF